MLLLKVSYSCMVEAAADHCPQGTAKTTAAAGQGCCCWHDAMLLMNSLYLCTNCITLDFVFFANDGPDSFFGWQQTKGRSQPTHTENKCVQAPLRHSQLGTAHIGLQNPRWPKTRRMPCCNLACLEMLADCGLLIPRWLISRALKSSPPFCSSSLVARSLIRSHAPSAHISWLCDTSALCLAAWLTRHTLKLVQPRGKSQAGQQSPSRNETA